LLLGAAGDNESRDDDYPAHYQEANRRADKRTDGTNTERFVYGHDAFSLPFWALIKRDERANPTYK
jgi:hypothetical protein